MADSDDQLPPIDWLIDRVHAIEQDRTLLPPTTPASGITTPITNFRPIKGNLTFESLPGELRNRIYDLSGCLRYWEPQQLTRPRTSLPGDASHHCHISECVAYEAVEKCRAAYLMVNGNETLRTTCGSWPRTRAELMRYLRSATGKQGPRCHKATVEQPALSRVSNKTRHDALSIFYGDHPFVAKLDGDGKKLLQWLDTIGSVDAARIRQLYLVYSQKCSLRYIERELLPELERRGLNVDKRAGVLQLVRMPFPFRHDECSILSELDRIRSGEDKTLA